MANNINVRLTGRKAEVGEYVVITNFRKALPSAYLKYSGSIARVTGSGSSPNGVDAQVGNDGQEIFLYHDEYKLLEVVQEVDFGFSSEPLRMTERVHTINAARKFVKDTLDTVFYYHDIRRDANIYYNDWVSRTEFVVNEEKRTVVAIVRKKNGNEILTRGVAKCMKEDTFNEDIGKAIALIKAFGLPQDERFFHAPNPEPKKEYTPGQVIEYHSKCHLRYGEKRSIVEVRCDRLVYDDMNYFPFTGFSDVLPRIYSDSNAYYEGLIDA